MDLIEKVKSIKIEDFDYPLPDEKIPRHPLTERASCKLLVRKPDKTICHGNFFQLPELLPGESVLVCNDTRVINARLSFQKETGSKIEVFLLEPLLPEDYVLMFQSTGSCEWSCMVGNLKRWKNTSLSKKLWVNNKEIVLSATRLEAREGNCHRIRFEWDDPECTFASIVEEAGNIPIPPYLKRESEKSDEVDYQTVYAVEKGSVAAPTAGLHFTSELMERLSEVGIEKVPLTLHVGAGTFQPVKTDSIGDHPMHTEVFSVNIGSLEKIIAAKKKGKGVVAVGTTSVRTLESLPYLGRHVKNGEESNVNQWEAYEEPLQNDEALEMLEELWVYMERNGLDTVTASTSIMIAPGFKWNVVDHMITNFHQPQSTLLLLVSSFLDKGKEENVSQCRAIPEWHSIYNEALAHDYRFLSYGDACLFI